MTEIPEDICETAYELAFVWAMPDEAALTRCTDAIARAILAERERERERCARIAEDTVRAINSGETFIIAGPAGIGRTIAAAIRNPESK